MSCIPPDGIRPEVSSKLTAALAAAARGHRVFALQNNSKNPTEIAWTLHATTDPSLIRGIWLDPVTGFERDLNVGILCNDGIVLDVDVKNGKRGRETLEALGLKLGDTFTVRTSTGGFHAYYRGIDRLVGSGHLVSSDDGIDVKSHNGYVVGPGSTIDGVPYVVVHDYPLRIFQSISAIG